MILSTPISPPARVTARGAENQVLLTWQNPSDPNFVRTRVIRKEGAAPTSASDGTILYEGDAREFTDTRLTPGITYHYAIFTLDRNLTPSSLVTVNARLGQLTSQQVIQQRAQELRQASSTPVGLLQGVGFLRTLVLGTRHQDITRLQQLLAQDKTLYPEGQITGYFGPATRRAIQRFQSKYNLAPPTHPAYGTVGPATRAKLNQVYNLTTNVNTEPATGQGQAINAERPTRSLSLGSRGPDVLQLQTFLQSQGFFPQGYKRTDFFGPMTREAVLKFQAQYHIETTGTVGPKTRQQVENLGR